MAWVWEGPCRGGKAMALLVCVCVLNFIYVCTWYVCTRYGVHIVREQLSRIGPLLPSLHGFQGSSSGHHVCMAIPLPPESSCQSLFWTLLFLRPGLIHPRLTSWSSCLYFSSAEIRGNDAQLPLNRCSFQMWVQAQSCISVGFAPVSLRICCSSTPGMIPDCASGPILALPKLSCWHEWRTEGWASHTESHAFLHGRMILTYLVPWLQDTSGPVPRARRSIPSSFLSVQWACQYHSDISPNGSICLWWR